MLLVLSNCCSLGKRNTKFFKRHFYYISFKTHQDCFKIARVWSLQIIWSLFQLCIHSNSEKKRAFRAFFGLFSLKIYQYPLKSSKKSSIWHLFVIQPFEYTRGRSRKRPRANTPSSPPSSLEISIEKDSESPNRNHKRPQKTQQLPQFKVYQDEILGPNSPEFSAQNELTPALFGCKTSEIQPYFVEKSSFCSISQDNHHEFHSDSTQQTFLRDYQQPLSSITATAVNRARKAPKIPQSWLKTQPNNHTSEFLMIYLLIFLI
jgi:hypothetical protein